MPEDHAGRRAACGQWHGRRFVRRRKHARPVDTRRNRKTRLQRARFSAARIVRPVMAWTCCAFGFCPCQPIRPANRRCVLRATLAAARPGWPKALRSFTACRLSPTKSRILAKIHFGRALDGGGLFTLDNCDTRNKWLPDAVASAATDGCSPTPETLHGRRARHLAGAGMARPDNGQSDLCQLTADLPTGCFWFA